MMKHETLDCVAVKRRAQRQIAKALAGKSPEEQVETLRHLAAQSLLRKELVKPRVERTPKAVRAYRKRHSTG
jgi:hypothetical protein